MPNDDLARRLALQQVEQVLRELTANLARVVRGAGKPEAVHCRPKR